MHLDRLELKQSFSFSVLFSSFFYSEEVMFRLILLISCHYFFLINLWSVISVVYCYDLIHPEYASLKPIHLSIMFYYCLCIHSERYLCSCSRCVTSPFYHTVLQNYSIVYLLSCYSALPTSSSLSFSVHYLFSCRASDISQSSPVMFLAVMTNLTDLLQLFHPCYRAGNTSPPSRYSDT